MGIPEPLFRRYFFVRFDRTDFNWVKLLHLPGNPVQRVIASQGRPIAVPDWVIDRVKAHLDPLGCLRPDALARAAQRLPKGTRVRLTEGAFIDQIGDLAEMSDGKRVRVLLQIFGAERPVPVPVPQSAVEVVE